MPDSKAIVAICSNHAQADNAIAALQQLGFDRKHVSVCGKADASDEEIVGCYIADGRLRAHGGLDTFWERLWCRLGEGGLFHVPGIGPVVVAGFLVSTLATTPKNSVAGGGLAELEEAIRSMGIPTDRDYVCETELRANKFVLIAFGTPEEVAKAKAEIEKAHSVERVISQG